MGKKGKKGGGKKGGGKGKKKDKKPKLSRDDELNAAVTNAVLWKQKLELTERQVIFFPNAEAYLNIWAQLSVEVFRSTTEHIFLCFHF